MLDKPRTAVTVPYSMRFIAAATAVLPPRARRWLGTTTGTARVFLDFDSSARADFEKRAQAATSVVEAAE